MYNSESDKLQDLLEKRARSLAFWHLDQQFLKDKSMETRLTLIQRVLNNPDDQSWEEFSYFYSEFIYNIIRGMGVVHHDAEDLRQQVLLKAWKGISNMTYDPKKAPFRSWMSTITKNTVRSFYSKKSTRQYMQEDELGEHQEYALIMNSDVEEIAETEWKVHVSNLALAEVKKRFSDKVIEVFEAFLEGQSGEEVAESCGVSINSIFVYKKRVQNAMMKEIVRLEQELS